MEVRPADLNDEALRELVRFNHAELHSLSPPEFAFVLDIGRLGAPGIHVLAAYDGPDLIGVGAVAVRGTEAELKSMRTVPDRLRSGVGTLLLEALTAKARDEGAQVLYLETGSGPGFDAAWQFYARHGFTPCGPFADYVESDFNRFMKKPLLVGVIAALSKSGLHAFSKQVSPDLDLVEGKGVAGDAHFGITVQHRSRVAIDPAHPNLRQVHLIAAELLEELAHEGFSLDPGDLGENILTRGLDLLALPRGTRQQLGDEAELELTGLRNPCGQIEHFRTGLLAHMVEKGPDGAIVRKAGVMAVVVKGGRAVTGDSINVSLPPLPHEPLDRV